MNIQSMTMNSAQRLLGPIRICAISAVMMAGSTTLVSADGLGDLVENVTGAVGLGRTGAAVDDVVDHVADGVDKVGNGVGHVTNHVTGGTLGGPLDNTVDGVASVLGGTGNAGNGGNGTGENGSGGGAGAQAFANENGRWGSGMFGATASGQSTCPSFGNNADYNGLRAVDQNSVVVGQVVGAQVDTGRGIEAVRIAMPVGTNGQTRCVTVHGGTMTAANGVILLPLDQTQLNL